MAAWEALTLLPVQSIFNCMVTAFLVSEAANEFAHQQSWLLESKGSFKKSYGAVLGSMIPVCLYDVMPNQCLTAKCNQECV